MIIEFEQKSEIFGLPPAIYMFMIVWMFLGFTGILTIFGFGEIANYAHLGGLIFGIFFAIMSLYFSKEINL
jgi:GlpG protein